MSTPREELTHSLIPDQYRVREELIRNDQVVRLLAIDTMIDQEVLLEYPGDGVRKHFASLGKEDQFLRDARARAAVDHPNIQRVKHVIAAAEMPILVLEPRNGILLSKLLERRAKLEARQVTTIAEQIAGAVQSLHAKGIVHRWIAPESILIDESSQTAVLTGFTFAKPMDLQGLSTFHKQDSRTESMPSYIAPEQVAGLPADARTDIFSLGCVIYRCVTGRDPFGTSDLQPPESPLAFASLPEELAELILRCLALKPKNRFRTMIELAAALREVPWPRAESYTSTIDLESSVDMLAAQFIAEREGDTPPKLEDYVTRLSTANDREMFMRIVNQDLRRQVFGIAPGLVLNGRYELHERIGEGGMGQVWSALDMHIGTKVGIKILNAVASSGLANPERIRREVELTQKVKHTGVVGIRDYQTQGDVPYFVMDLVDGIPLSVLTERAKALQRPLKADDISQIIDREPPPGGDDLIESGSWYGAVTRITLQLLRILEAAHAETVVHRDIKPQNIMVQGGGRPFLLDFGLARSFTSASTQHSAGLFGTIHYIAPEQAHERKTGANTQSDLYQLGAVFYELLTLHKAFDGDDIGELLSRIANGSFERPRQKNSAVPAVLEEICLCAMSNDLDRRYATALDFREDLESYLEGKTPVAVRGSMSRHLRSLLLEYRTLAVYSLAIGLGALLFAVLQYMIT